MLQIGSIVDGKYKILNKIGQGGMSNVYLDMNERANKQWAIKEVRKDGVQNFEVVKQGLIAETDLLKKLSHPNLPSIVDVIDGEGTFLIVMDYIEGKSLNNILREQGAQNQEDVVEWAKQLCDVLGYLHSRKPPIIYRDMKPANIMLKPDGKVMLIDFGIAREFKENSVADTVCLGTRGYAAPEQYGGHGQTDGRTDIYCLGATLYHLLTGHNPSEPPYEMYPISYWNPTLSTGLEEIILKCTQQNPSDRYQSCAELMYDLEHYSELDIEYRRAQTRKWRAFIVTAALAAATGIGAAGFRRAENITTSKTYNEYISQAESLESIDPEQCVEYYADAIELAPEQEDAYINLLNFYLWQHNEESSDDTLTVCVFSSDEEQELRRMLGITGTSSRSNEEYLQSNSDGYNKFAYDLGVAYFYSYEGSGNKAAAKKWLGIAKEASPGDGEEQLNETEIARAANLYEIASYYDNLNLRNQAGDSMISYKDYWSDLTDMAEQERVETGNNVNKLLIYKELATQIFSSSVEFKGAGITEEEMEKELARIEASLEDMEIVDGSANADYEEELKQIVYESVNMARNNLAAVFNTQNIEGGGQDAADTAED